MGRCSYTWKKRDEEKQCQKETWEGSDEYCIFHDPSPDKDVDLFKEELRIQMQSETEKHNFFGYYFPKYWDFSGWEFELDVDFYNSTFRDAIFWGAIFQGTVHFKGAKFQDAGFLEAVFQGYANFTEATFQGTADFTEATFQNADFSGATFQNADFEGAEFQNATFRKADFQGDAYFLEATFQDADFLGATFQNAHFLEATFQGDVGFREASFRGNADFKEATFQHASFYKATFQNADFSNATFQKYAYFNEATFQKYVNLWEATFQKYVSLRDLETIYRDLKQNNQRDGNYSRAGDFYYQEMEMKKQNTPSITHRLWLEFYHGLAGYGEKPERTLLSSFFTMAIFAFSYWGLACLQYPGDIHTISEELVCSVYFSFVTFTTLGLGDIHPVNNLGRMLVCCEAVIGAFLIALFVVVFARKMIR